MTQDNIVKLSQPGTFSDPLTEVLRDGARALLAHAVEAEVAGFLGGHADKLTDDGHRRLVRHGHLPEREIMTGIGAVAVRCPRVRDRAADGGERIRAALANDRIGTVLVIRAVSLPVRLCFIPVSLALPNLSRLPSAEGEHHVSKEISCAQCLGRCGASGADLRFWCLGIVCWTDARDRGRRPPARAQASHRRDAEQTCGRRLAAAPRQFRRLGLQHARSGQRAECRSFATGLGLEHGARLSGRSAAGARRRAVPCQSEERRAALDGRSGDLLWEYRRELPKIEGGYHNDLFDRARGTIVLYDDKVLLATADAHIVALDAHTGKVIWDRRGRLPARLHVHRRAAGRTW